MRIGDYLSGKDGIPFRFLFSAIYGACVSVSLALLLWVAGFMFDVYLWDPKRFWVLVLVPVVWGLVSRACLHISVGFTDVVHQLVRLTLACLFFALLLSFLVDRIRLEGDVETWHPVLIGLFLGLPFVWGVLGIFWFDYMIGGASYLFNLSFGTPGDDD